MLNSPGVVLGCALVSGPYLVEARQLRFSELDLECPLSSIELLHRTGADDWRGHDGLVQEPCDADIGRLLPEVGTELLIGLDLIAHALQRFRRAPCEPALALLFLADHARQHSAVEWAPRNDSHTVVLTRGQDLQLHLPFGEVVDRLFRDQSRRQPAPRALLCLDDVPAGEVA